VLRAARDALRITHEKMAHDARVRSFFKPELLACILDWDDAAAAYLGARGRGIDVEAARDVAAESLRLRGHPDDVVIPYTDAIVKYNEYLEAFAEVFDVAPIDPPRREGSPAIAI
jgi:hypothetical protein